MNCFWQGSDGQIGGVNQLVGGPNADLHQVFSLIRDEMELDVVSGFNAKDLKRISANGDLAIAIGRPGVMQTKDIFGRGEGLGQREGSEERSIFALCFFKTHGWDFMGS